MLNWLIKACLAATYSSKEKKNNCSKRVFKSNIHRQVLTWVPLNSQSSPIRLLPKCGNPDYMSMFFQKHITLLWIHNQDISSAWLGQIRNKPELCHIYLLQDCYIAMYCLFKYMSYQSCFPFDYFPNGVSFAFHWPHHWNGLFVFWNTTQRDHLLVFSINVVAVSEPWMTQDNSSLRIKTGIDSCLRM